MGADERGVFVDTVTIYSLIVEAFRRSGGDEDSELFRAAQSLQSALVLHLGATRATLPESVRPAYNYIMEHV